MVNAPVLGDLILTAGLAVRALGSVAHPGSQETTLWLADPMRPESPTKIHGGNVEVHFRTAHQAPPSSANAPIVGVWDGRRIVDARWDGPEHEPLMLVPAPRDSRPLVSVSSEEFYAVHVELEARCLDVTLTGGGSREQDYLHVRNVTDEVAAVYAELWSRRYPLDLYVSIVPA